MKIIKQDVTKLDHGVIAHGCNCQGVMGSGVARALRDRWPEIFEPYYNLCVTGQFSSQLLGKMSIVHINEFPELYVANCLTQHTYGHSGKFANIDAIEQSMRDAFCFAYNAELPLYAVKIGCLRGGLDWETEVKPVFEQLADKYKDVEFFVCDI